MAFLSDSTMVAVLVFLAAGTMAFCVMALVRVKSSVKRRTADLGAGEGQTAGSRSLRHSSMKAAARVIEYTQKHYAEGGNKETKVLRRRLMSAGYYDPKAVAYFFLCRTMLAIVLATLVFFFAPTAPGSPVPG